jgi:hypothetical protein
VFEARAELESEESAGANVSTEISSSWGGSISGARRTGVSCLYSTFSVDGVSKSRVQERLVVKMQFANKQDQLQ